MARQDRWKTGFGRGGEKAGTTVPAPDRAPADLEHTQPMERTEDLDAEAPATPEDTAYIGAALPRIEQMPPGIIVKEDVMGRATGQWIVQIRCECGRRWFDVAMVKTARCPRCENMVVVDPID